tara:strand:- start:24525 stop:26213 length:1689 start_codon:yes stop_codon:yes gene_type:complete
MLTWIHLYIGGKVIMRIMKYVLALVFALGLAIPSFAVELSLGGFPSFMRFRWRSIQNATYHNLLTPGVLHNISGANRDSTGENINFADMTLRLTPQLVLSDAVTIRASIDVLSNAIAGGATDGLFGEDSDGSESGGAVMDDIRSTDRFNGALLHGNDAVTTDYGSFTVKFMHADINLGDRGFVRIGRQPFDFGMGIYANGGHDPYSDLGFNIDRLLWLKGFATSMGSLTVVLVSDYISGGGDAGTDATSNDVGLFEGNGQTVDYLAAALILNNGGFTTGAYFFPYIEQNNMRVDLDGQSAGTRVNWDMTFQLYDFYVEYKTADYRFISEIAGGYGELKADDNPDYYTVNNQYVAAARLELFNAGVDKLSLEAGYSQGDHSNSTSSSNDYEGNIIRGNGAYQLDNLLFKHVLPSLYQRSGSIMNAKYLKADADIAVGGGDNLNLAVLMAWLEETQPAGVGVDFGANLGASDGVAGTASSYYGTEYEATYSTNLVDGVELSFIASIIDVGDGLNDLLIAAAYSETTAGQNAVKSAMDTESTIWAFQSRLLIFIDDFFKAPAATK